MCSACDTLQEQKVHLNSNKALSCESHQFHQNKFKGTRIMKMHFAVIGAIIVYRDASEETEADNQTDRDEVISIRAKNHHIKGCIFWSSLLCETLLPQSPLCSPSRALCHTSVLWKTSPRGVWGHCLIACDMLTWLLWLTWPPNIQPLSARSVVEALFALPLRLNSSSWWDTADVSLAAASCLVLWGLTHNGCLMCAIHMEPYTPDV